MNVNPDRLPQTTSRYIKRAYRNKVVDGVTVEDADGNPVKEPILRPVIQYPLRFLPIREKAQHEVKVLAHGGPERTKVLKRRLQRYMSKPVDAHRKKMAQKLMRRMAREDVM